MSFPSVLVVLGPPHTNGSRVNRALAAAVSDLPNVTTHDIHQACPDRLIDVAAGQQLVRDHHVLVLQSPLYWYSLPGFLKQWLDDVMEPGFAHASRPLLTGRTLQLVTSTGSSERDYRPGGSQGFTVEQLLRPLEQTARRIGLTHAEPFVVYGHDLTAEEPALHARRYRSPFACAVRAGRIRSDEFQDGRRDSRTVADPGADDHGSVLRTTTPGTRHEGDACPVPRRRPWGRGRCG